MAIPPEEPIVEETEPEPVFDMNTESGKVASGLYKFCKCHNLVTGDELFCPFCRRFNPFGNAKACPTCGSQL